MSFFNSGPKRPRSPHEFRDFRPKKPEPGGIPTWLKFVLAVFAGLCLTALLRWAGVIGP